MARMSPGVSAGVRSSVRPSVGVMRSGSYSGGGSIID